MLISPKGPLYRHRSGALPWWLRYMPLTLPVLAALVPDELDAEVVCVDEGVEEVDLGLEADLVGLTVITGNATRAYELADHFRARGMPVVLGGPHVTLVPEEAALHADSVVIGHAEQSWPRLLRDLVAGGRPRLASRYQPPEGLGLEAGGGPLPDRSVLRRRRYVTAAVFEATRGCAHACDFCVAPSAWGRRAAQRPVEAVIEDIRRVRARHLTFVDLNLISDREYAARLFEALMPLGVRWFGLATTTLADDEPLLDLAARSGCRGLLMGLESMSAAGLRQARKGFNHPERYGELVKRLHARRIALQGCFVLGMDEDTPEVAAATARFAVAAGIDLPRFAILTPFPGTPLFARLEAEGRLLGLPWECYDGQHVVFQPAQMSVDQLHRGNLEAWRIAYSASGVLSRLRRSAAPLPVALLTNLGYATYARRLRRALGGAARVPAPVGGPVQVPR